MSNTLARSASSSGVSRSKSRLPSPTTCRAPATNMLRGLLRLLPLPCANTTTPRAPAGTVSRPGSGTVPASTITSRISSASVPSLARFSRSTTSSSPVCAKSWYHWPMARNGSGASAQTTSSATPASTSIEASGATGTARTTRDAPGPRASRPRGGAGRDAVIHHDRGLAAQRYPRVPGAVTGRPPAQLGPLPLLDPGELPVADLFGLDHVVVDDPDTVLAERTHGQLGLGRQADLADQDDVQRGAERPGDLIGDRDAAPGQPQHHGARSPLDRRPAGQQASQPAAGVGAIEERHLVHPRSCLEQRREQPPGPRGVLPAAELPGHEVGHAGVGQGGELGLDRKSTRL